MPKMQVYKPWVRFARRCIARFSHWRTIVCGGGTLPDAPAVYVVHHQNLYGPIHAVALLPIEAHLWVFHPFYDRKACFDQYYGYTFTQRFRWPRPLAWTAARLLALVVPGVMHSIGAIPVYRSSRQILETMDLSRQALLAGENIMLCPDTDYSSSADETGTIYQGFLRLERDYHRRTGRHLPFVPVVSIKGERTVSVGAPILFEDGRSFKEQQEEVAQRLIDSLNRGRALK